MYRPALEPIAHHLGWSAAVAAIPLATLFAALAVVRARAWLSALASLAAALLVATLAYAMPTGQALLAAGEGAAFGLFPLVWTFATAIWIYTMTVRSGHFAILGRAFTRVSDDRRIQALVIAFCFGSLLEALAGQGTPVAITTVMLLSLGFNPVRAAMVALVANTVPAAFGPLGLPITTLAKVTDLPSNTLGAMAGRQVPVVAFFVPLVVVLIADGRRGLREAWQPAVACGASFALAQFVTANYITPTLADIVAALASAAVVGVMVTLRRAPLQVQAVPVMAAQGGVATLGGGVVIAGGSRQGRGDGAGGADDRSPRGGGTDGTPQDSRRDVVLAYAPYLIITAIFALSQWQTIADTLNARTVTFHWPGLHLLTSGGKASTLPLYKFNWLSAPGSLLLIAGAVTMILLRIPVRSALGDYGRTLIQLRWAIVCVAGLLAISFVMNASGQTTTLGTWMAGAGRGFAALSPVLGWLGVALSGSDTSSNSLFGALQVTAAHKAGLSPTLLAAANASGGVAGKMISLQNLTIGATSVGLTGREGDLLRRMLPWSLALLGGISLLIWLQSTSALSWMVP
jgi:lactate permease